MEPFYYLPHHPSLTSLDPLDVCGETNEHINEDGSVRQAAILAGLLDGAEHDLIALETQHAHENARLICLQWSRRFQELLGDVAYSLHNDGSLDTGFLADNLSRRKISELRLFRICLFQSCRALSLLFPESRLALLSTTYSDWSFSVAETDALLAHLFLGTLQVPIGNQWGRPGFLAYYRSDPPIESTVSGYISTLVEHFSTGGYNASLSAPDPFTFRWSTAASMPPAPQCKIPAAVCNLHVVPEAEDPSPVRNSRTFVLLSAHSQPGPGPAGTHEERLDGQSPALAIASLIAPLLKGDATVVTSAFPVHTRWIGHNRDARLVEVFERDARPVRHYIIADALELDAATDGMVIPDLQPGNVEREIRKLYAGFNGAVQQYRSKSAEAVRGHDRMRVEVFPWGCQSFGGNLTIKAQCMMMAAALAAIDSLELFVPEQKRHDAEEIQKISAQRLSVSDILDRLVHIDEQ